MTATNTGIIRLTQLEERALQRAVTLPINVYYDGVPYDMINDRLSAIGLFPMEPIINGERRVTMQLCKNDNTPTNGYIHLSWYQMPSGRYEITLYSSTGE